MKCAYCGKECYGVPIFAAGSKRVCSEECRENYQKTLPVLYSSKCVYCGKEGMKTIGHDRADYYDLCSLECKNKCEKAVKDYALKANEEKRFEEIKRMAWELFCHWNADDPILNPASAWENAEDFYNYAKEKEKEVGGE